MTSGATQQPTTIVCTLGMHRSGTSLVSRLLNLLGVFLGPEAVVQRTGEDNPTGYWEHPTVVSVNDEILARFGGRWNKPPVFPSSWARDPRLDDLRARASDFLAGQSFGRLWGWKDPRACLTLPFWQDIIGPMRYVVCLRNPQAVTASLARRDGLSIEEADRLWLAHVHASLTHTGSQTRTFIFYEDLLADWRTQLSRLAAFVGRPDRASDRCVQHAVDAFVTPTLCHYHSSTESLMRDESISFSTKELYAALRDGSSRLSRPVGDGLRSDGSSATEGSPAPGGLALESALRTAAAALERDRHAREIASQAETIDALRRECAQLTARCQALEETRETLREIQASRAWRLVTSSRSVLTALLPSGTKRRDAFDTVLSHVARRLPPAAAERSSGGSAFTS